MISDEFREGAEIEANTPITIGVVPQESNIQAVAKEIAGNVEACTSEQWSRIKIIVEILRRHFG